MRETRTVPYETPTVHLNSGPLFRFLMLFALLSTALALPIPQRNAKCSHNLKINTGALQGTTICVKQESTLVSNTALKVYRISESDGQHDSNWVEVKVSWHGGPFTKRVRQGEVIKWRGSVGLNVNKRYAIILEECDNPDDNNQLCQESKRCFGPKTTNGERKWGFQECP